MKNERITIRVSDQEKKQIEERAAAMSMSVSEYLLKLVRDDTVRDSSLKTDHLEVYVKNLVLQTLKEHETGKAE